MPKLQLLDDEIGRKLAEAERSGELQAAECYGKPLREEAGWEQTPDDLRMPFKILKNAGVVPPEVELLRERAQLRLALEEATTEVERMALRSQLSDLEQKVSLRLEALRSRGPL